VSNRELDLLIALTGQSPRSPRELIEAVWGPGGGDDEMLERLVHRTQLKLRPVASDRRLLIQEPDGGYRLGD
jgi:DNA-binding response OmpR family regulator